MCRRHPGPKNASCSSRTRTVGYYALLPDGWMDADAVDDFCSTYRYGPDATEDDLRVVLTVDVWDTYPSPGARV